MKLTVNMALSSATLKGSLTLSVLALFFVGTTAAQNPLIGDQFTADPSARVFEDKMYVYPSHDLDCGTDWFCMKDYHVFSSEDLVDWTDHGVIVSQEDVPWVDTTENAMWAPDAIERDGTYYFYFPAIADSSSGFEGRRIGVATSETPHGPFEPQPEPIKNVHGIDPNVFIDDDGQAYLYWSGEEIYAAKLKDNMLELASEPKVLDNLPEEGHKEGPWMFKRNGTYYMTYPHVERETERLEYAMGENPMGPFTVTGVIMEAFPDCWTNHHSIVQYENQWYLFYHHNDYSPDFDKNRSIRADSLFFNDDGTIQKVPPTLRGVGRTDAEDKIQLDRYSKKSEAGSSIAFLDTSDTFKGWKTILDSTDSWIQYNSVDFGTGNFDSVMANVSSTTGGRVHVHLNEARGPVAATVDVPKTDTLRTITAPVSGVEPGVHDLVVSLTSDSHVEIDWLRFE